MNRPAVPLGAADDTATTGEAGSRGWFGFRRRSLSFSAAVRQRVVETVYSQPGMLIAGAICTAGIAAAQWYKTGDRFWLVFFVGALLLFTGRWLDTRAFEAASPEPTRWARRFAVGSWANGLWWGSAAVAALTQGSDPVAQYMFIAVEVGYIGAATVRSGSLLPAAAGQILLAEVPLLVACLLSQEPYIRLFSLFALLHILSCLLLVRFMSQTRIALVLADERNGRLLERLRQANALLEAKAMTDELTGLANRRAFDAALAAEVQRAVRAGQPLSLLLLDLDRFKLLNDQIGHQAGDECLAAVGTALSETVRDVTDTVARYGGEEFAVILPFTDAAGARTVAETLRATVAELRWEYARGRALPLTVSIGGATVLPERNFTPAQLITMADKALYAAKEAGRNRVAW
jgi:diguanylate cyclase (GGDEF)-like protein